MQDSHFHITGISHLIALCRYCIFSRLKVYNPALGKSVGAIFPVVFAHLLSLCHVFVFLEVFQLFHSSSIMVVYGQ